MTMKTAESDQQKQQGAGHKSPDVASQSAPTSTVVAPPTTASEEGLQLLVQARLSVSSPNDPFEHEAESMADEFVKSIHGRTMSAPTSSAGSVARSVPDSGLVEGGGGLATTDDTASAIMSARAGGQALSGDVRARFEGFFGADLGGVKIHNDGTSDNLCRSINAEAFTTGNDVFFSSRNFKPGSSSGDHLLAHELTHVVQQGNAPALSRRALPDIQRGWWPFSSDTEEEPKKEPAGRAKSDGLRQQVAITGQLIELGQLPAGGAKADLQNSDIHVASEQSDATKAAGNSTDSFGLIACTAALFSGIFRLLSEWNSESYASSRNQLVAVVKAAIGAAQKSTSLAQTAGATIATSAIPGLGLAINVIDFAYQCLKFDDTDAGIVQSEEKIARLKAGPQTPSNRQILASLVQLSESIKSEHKRVIVRMTADVVGMFGQLMLITGVGAIAGAPMVVVGAAMAGLTALQGKVAEWSSAGSIIESREKLAAAKAKLEEHKKKAPGDPAQDAEDEARLTKDVEDSSIENLGLDAYAAACELIKYGAGAFRIDGTIDQEVISLLSSFDIDINWLIAYRNSTDKDQMLDKGAKIICEFVGKAPNPLNLKQDLIKARDWAWKAIKFVVRGTAYCVFWGGRLIAQMTVAGAEGLYDNVLLPLWNAAIAVPGKIWDFFRTAEDINEKAVTDPAKPVEKKTKRAQDDYFANETEIVYEALGVHPIIETYFKAKAARGTDVKPESVTDLLKGPYKKFIATAKKSPTDGTKPFASSEVQIGLVDTKVMGIIKALAPDRVKQESIHVDKGIVDFTYVGKQIAKTRGWFADFRGREAVED